MKSLSDRRDIPTELARKAAAVDPALLRWLEVAYPTDEQHERRRRNPRQLVMPIAHRSPR